MPQDPDPVVPFGTLVTLVTLVSQLIATVAGLYTRRGGREAKERLLHKAGDFGDFGVSFVDTVAGRNTRRGGPRLSVRGYTSPKLC